MTDAETVPEADETKPETPEAKGAPPADDAETQEAQVQTEEASTEPAHTDDVPTPTPAAVQGDPWGHQKHVDHLESLGNVSGFALDEEGLVRIVLSPAASAAFTADPKLFLEAVSGALRAALEQVPESPAVA
jgi:hypothetical protein